MSYRILVDTVRSKYSFLNVPLCLIALHAAIAPCTPTMSRRDLLAQLRGK